jgi:DNA-binding transcriptional LysR family regulator
VELKQIRALQAIISTGSFGEAAKRMHLTQSALSHQIRKLEKELDQPLLVRSRPKVHATPAGHLVVAAGERIFAELAGLKEQFSEGNANALPGTLRVASSKLAVVYLFGDLCEAFIAHYPKTELILSATENSGEAVRRVSEGAVDLAWTPFPIAAGQLDSIVLGRAEYVFIVSRDHPLAGKATASVEEIAAYPFVLFERGSGTRDISDEIFLRSSGYPKVVTESNDTEFVKEIVAIGAGVALIPVFALAKEVSSGQLCMLRLKGRRLMVEFGIVHRRSNRVPSVDHFRDLCLQMRGPAKISLTLENAGKPAFKRPEETIEASINLRRSNG